MPGTSRAPSASVRYITRPSREARRTKELRSALRLIHLSSASPRPAGLNTLAGSFYAPAPPLPFLARSPVAESGQQAQLSRFSRPLLGPGVRDKLTIALVQRPVRLTAPRPRSSTG